MEAIDDESFKLSWAAPKSDGGAPITGYILEMRGHTNIDNVVLAWRTPRGTGRCGYIVEVRGPEDEDFHVVEILDGDITDYTVTGLVEMMDYEFRVKAANEAGVGKFIKDNDEVEAEEEYVKGAKPRIGGLFPWQCRQQLVAMCCTSIVFLRIKKAVLVVIVVVMFSF